MLMLLQQRLMALAVCDVGVDNRPFCRLFPGLFLPMIATVDSASYVPPRHHHQHQHQHHHCHHRRCPHYYHQHDCYGRNQDQAGRRFKASNNRCGGMNREGDRMGGPVFYTHHHLQIIDYEAIAHRNSRRNNGGKHSMMMGGGARSW